MKIVLSCIAILLFAAFADASGHGSGLFSRSRERRANRQAARAAAGCAGAAGCSGAAAGCHGTAYILPPARIVVPAPRVIVPPPQVVVPPPQVRIEAAPADECVDGEIQFGFFSRRR